MRTVYREKRYYCGEYLDVYIYPTYAQARSRGKRSKPTSAAQNVFYGIISAGCRERGKSKGSRRSST